MDSFGLNEDSKFCKLRMKANTNKLIDIFHGGRLLKIPFFQRSYVWDEEEWNRFISDLLDKQNDSVTSKNPLVPKFMGAIILKQEPTQTGRFGDVRILVDGQQRLTTIVILMKVLSLKKDLGVNFDRQFKDVNGNVVIEHNMNDYIAFNEITSVDSLSTAVPEEGKIRKLFHYLVNSANVDLLDWDFVMNILEFVVIDLDPGEDEQEIFDAINSLGVRLTTSELLKNYLFDRDQKRLYEETWRKEFEDEFAEFWNKDFTSGKVSRSLQDVFFHALLQVEAQRSSRNVSNQHKDRFSKVGELFKSYCVFVEEYNVDKVAFIEEIVRFAGVFRERIDFDILSKSVPRNPGMERLSVIVFGLENGTVLPYLLYVLRYADEVEIPRICLYLEAFLCRRLICKNESNNYNKLFTKELIGNKILTGSSLQDFINKQSADAVNRMPSDFDYRQAWSNSRVTNKIAKGVLYLLETGTSSGHVSLNGLNSYSLEHVMPKKWKNHWPSPQLPWTNDHREAKLLTLGNLTLLTQKLNVSVRDYDWSRKLDGVSGKPGLNACSGGIEIFATYLNKQDWNEDVIELRAAELFEKSLKIWGENPVN